MKTISIKSVSVNAMFGTIIVVAKDGIRYQHVQSFNLCKAHMVLLKVKAAGVINTQYWNVVKSETMVLAHKVARAIVAEEGCAYREALSCALSWVMSNGAMYQDIIDTQGIDAACEDVMQCVYPEYETQVESEIALLEKLCAADTPTLQDVQQFPVLTDAEWDMIENKGNPEFCNYTLDEVMSEPVVDSIAPAVVKEEEVECPTINLVPANPVDTPVKVKAPLVSHINHAAMPRALEIIAEVQAKLAAQSK